MRYLLLLLPLAACAGDPPDEVSTCVMPGGDPEVVQAIIDNRIRCIDNKWYVQAGDDALVRFEPDPAGNGNEILGVIN